MIRLRSRIRTETAQQRIRVATLKASCALVHWLAIKPENATEEQAIHALRVANICERFLDELEEEGT